MSDDRKCCMNCKFCKRRYQDGEFLCCRLPIPLTHGRCLTDRNQWCGEWKKQNKEEYDEINKSLWE